MFTIRRATLLITMGLAACAGPTPKKWESAYVPPVAVAAAVTLAPAALDPEIELQELSRFQTTPALLRTAYLELLQRRPDRTLDATSEVLWARTKPSTNDESFARWLRAEAYTMQGKVAFGQHDRDRAAELATDPELRRLIAAATPPAASAEPPADPDLVIQPRTAWQARAADRTNVEPMTKIERVTIHHSAMLFRDTRPQTCAAQIHQIQREHMRNRNYGDIGYHFLIDPSGRIWQGREMRYQGAHASGANNIGNVGICLLGNFMRGRGGQGPTNEQVQAMRRLVADLMNRYRFGADRIYCHSDFKVTECPGVLMEPVVAKMVRDLRRTNSGALADAAADQ